MLFRSRKNYDEINDDVNQYAKPLYTIARNQLQLNENEDGSDERDYFAIRISWAQGANNMTDSSAGYWNYAFNNKETDIIYISSKYSTSTD